MIGALLVGFVAGVVARVLAPHDVFRHMSGPASWGVSILVGLGGALLGFLIFTLGLGIGDDDIFDWGGIVGAIIGTLIVLAIAGWAIRRRQSRSTTSRYAPPPQ
ncbi:MAG: GlsB/YeaQ/YmgE family stress response membrane protein [Gaiellaceae bacterium]